MAHLTLAGLSADGKRLLLVSDKGVEFSLDITPELRAALDGDAPRRQEMQMDSVLRPRDIQARIRAGETPEAVAQTARTSVDKVLVYARPVLAEREHVAVRAQRSSLRRSGEAPGHARTLGSAVEAHLRSCNVDPASVEWDAWRREDGRWALTARFAAPERQGLARFTYDVPGNYVVVEDDEARWLVGEAVAGSGPVPAPTGDLDLAAEPGGPAGPAEPPRRRLSAVPSQATPPADELPLGVDAIELVAEEPVEAFLDDSPASDDPVLREEAAEAAAAEEVEEVAAPASIDDAGAAAHGDHAAHGDRGDGDQDAEGDPGTEGPARRQVQKKRGRASVPSWDEIMFGGGDQ